VLALASKSKLRFKLALSGSAREFLGLTPASISAALGLILASFLLLLDLGIVLRNFIGATAVLLIIFSLYLNLKKGLNNRWRKLNFLAHLGMLMLVIVAVMLCNLRPYIKIKLEEPKGVIHAKLGENVNS
jgi:hypothetical protein